MGMRSAVLRGGMVSGVRRTSGAWPQVPAAWVEA